MNFEKDIQIDEHDLEHEWLRQANLFNQYAVMAAEKRKQARQLKQAINVVRAEVLLQVRQSFLDSDEKMPNLDTLNAMVEVSPKLTDAFTAYNEAEEAAEIAKAGADSLYQKKEALQDLVKMKLTGYYGEPKEPSGTMSINAAGKASGKMKDAYNKKRSK